MKKSYPDQLVRWIERRTSTAHEKNLVAFLAIRDDVEAALDARFPVKTIWKHMRESGRIEVAYDTFRRYVRHHIRSQENRLHEGVVREALPPPSRQVARSVQESRPVSGAISGFTFNSAPRKEDLL